MAPERTASASTASNRADSPPPSRRPRRRLSWLICGPASLFLLAGCAIASPTTPAAPTSMSSVATIPATSTPSASVSSVQPSSSSPVAPSVATRPSVPKASTLIKAGICGRGGKITGHTFFTHPTWGSSVLVTCLDLKVRELQGIAVLDAAGQIRWSHKIEGGYYTLETATPGTDNTGNLFVIYDPGRYQGIAVYRPVKGSMKTIAGLYDDGEGKEDGRFYYAKLLGSGGSGRYRIRHFVNDCDPSCSNGTTTSTDYVWNGSDYAKR